MTNPVIPAEAVEAAAKQMAVNDGDLMGWILYQSDAQKVLEAAAPHMMGRAFEEGYGLGYSDCVWSKGHEPRARNPYMKDSK